MTGPVKCLLVDDLEENLLALQAVLRSDSVELLLAQSGVAALNFLLEHDVALALIDVQMPEMDGFELAELMRGSERTRHVPIIFVTAGVRDQHRVFRGYETGAVDFLFKPVDPVIVKNKADVFFQLYRQKQQLAEELRARTETLRLNEMFSAVLGHDLRSPLQAIVSAAQTVTMTAAEPRTVKAAELIVRSGMRMSRMIADLLDFSRARIGGGIPVSPQDCDLEVIVDRVVEEQRRIHEHRRIEVNVAGDTRVRCDQDRIAQVLSNLIGNGLQHGAENCPVVVEVAGGASGVEILVRNDGVIDAAALGYIFDPFRSASERREPSEGLGLGLYIAQQIVRAHRGHIAVSCSERQTSFRVFVPRE
jgi:signal transduction histidine kinase